MVGGACVISNRAHIVIDWVSYIRSGGLEKQLADDDVYYRIWVSAGALELSARVLTMKYIESSRFA